jgi:hypothetical protein
MIAVIITAVRFLRRKPHEDDITTMYRQKKILTDREYSFYKKLRKIAFEYNVQIFTKVRLADLIEPKDDIEKSKWWTCFNKIKSKHIDFVLADYDTNIILLIELDDSTHQRSDRMERDKFVNAVLENTGYTLLHTYGKTDEIISILNDTIST